MDLEKLNSFSQKIYRLIEKCYPEWISCAREADHEKGALNIAVISPAGTHFEICTCNDEVTVAYGFYHSHFDTFKEAKAFVDDLKSGQIFIASIFEGGIWIRSEEVKVSDLDHYKVKFKVSIRVPLIVGWNPN
jgi:hypothetical protein